MCICVHLKCMGVHIAHLVYQLTAGFQFSLYSLTADYTASEAAGEYVITNGGNKEAPDGEWHEVN